MDIRATIAKKRDGEDLSSTEITELVSGCADGSISDAQIAAMLMAIFIRGMSLREVADLTAAMAKSGAQLDLSHVQCPTVDKHSTGGVGDKTTLVVAPLVAALGVAVPKISGRSLGHTGGTLDKLECIPGLTTALSPDRFSRQVAQIGVAIAAQTGEMVPADRRIYGLRDMTATVGSLALGVSSIMSKKLAAGADGIVLDVKVSGDDDVDEARHFAKSMVEIGTRCGKRTVALLTCMHEPIGFSVGDAAELCEAIEALAGNAEKRFAELCAIVSGHMLSVGGVARDAAEGSRMATQALANGLGLAKLADIVRWQDGDPSFVEHPGTLLEGCVRNPIDAPRDGYVTAIDAFRIGSALRELKDEAGVRQRLCGVLLHKKTGWAAAAGECLATVLSPKGIEDGANRFAREVEASFAMADEPSPLPEILIDVVEE